MTSKSLPFQSYQLDSLPASGSRLVNCFVEQLPEDAKSPLLLSRTAGINDWTTAGTGPILGMLGALGNLFVVSGTKLYKVDSLKNATLLGDIGAGTHIDMDRNATSVVVVNTPNAYYYDGATFGQITDVDFPGASDVEFLDNFLLFVEPNSGRFFCADLGSATSFDALNFATAEAVPDNLVGMKVDHRQVILFGEESIEIWENTGASGFPFERAINGFVEIGCFNGRTCQKLDNSVFWLANDYTVRRLDGITPVRVSTHAIEQAIARTTISSASAFTYSQAGHFFYVLSFSDRTFVYDATTKLWHERQTYGFDNWTALSHAQAFGLELVGHSETSDIGTLDKSVYTEWGSTQRMAWTYQPIYADNLRAMHDRFEIIMETGIGLTSGQGSNPVCMLEKSDDGGMTWDSVPDREIGPLGEYQQRVIWHRLGSARQRVYRAAVSDPVRVNVTDTQIWVRNGYF